MAAREKAALFNVDAHEVALAAREEAASALFNANAHGVAVHGNTREKAALLTLMPMNSVAAREDRGLRVRCLTWMSVSGSDSQGRGCII